MLLPLVSLAAEWSAEPSVSLKEEYNDNIHLTMVKHPSVTATTLSPSVKFNYATEISNVSGGATLSANKYSGEQGLDRVDQFYTLSSNYKTERSIFGLNANYTKSFASQYDNIATGSLIRRTDSNIAPSWIWSLSEKNALRLDYQLSQVKYDSGTDYKVNTATFSLIQQYTERDKLIFQTYNQKTDINSGVVKSDSYGLSGGVTHDFSETLSGSLTIGGYTVKTTTITGTQLCPSYSLGFNGSGFFIYCGQPLVTVFSTSESRNRGMSFDMSLNKQFETANLTAQYSRKLQPGDNTLVETDQATLILTDKWSPLVSGSISSFILRSRNKGGVLANNRRYYTVSPSLSWRLSESWVLDTGYRYERNEYEQTNFSASANSVFAQIKYDWPKFAISR